MSDNEMAKHATLNATVRNSVLEAIKTNIETEKNVNLANIGELSSALDQLAARDLYSKGPPGDAYSKNTQRVNFGEELINPAVGLKMPGGG